MAENNPLLTPKAFETSLSPPRVPPFGSIHRDLYTAKVGNKNILASKLDRIQSPRHYHVDRGSQASDNDHEEDIHRLLLAKVLSAARLNKAHPHMTTHSPDAPTRYIGSKLWSVASMNYFRDSGAFRQLVDALVAGTAAPALALTAPREAVRFLTLTRHRETLSYGTHSRQFVDIWEPETKARRLVVFYHGGAWGSGHSWMYRLVAAPFLDQGYAVGVCSYRVYPDGKIEEQLDDLDAAIQALYCRFGSEIRMTLSGHSSGAHVALLWLVRRLFDETKTLASIDSFIGLSGPYDIAHHFDYEAGRGVEELSPMKPVNGASHHAFRHNSPAQWLLRSMAKQTPLWSKEQNVLPRIVLMHGIEDDTVPFTATAEAARILSSCGIQADEIYLERTGHQDVPVQFMTGGLTRKAVLEWIRTLDNGEMSVRSKTVFHRASKL